MHGAPASEIIAISKPALSCSIIVGVIILLTAVQYLVYVNLLGFPGAASLGISVAGTMSLRWHILVLE